MLDKLLVASEYTDPSLFPVITTKRIMDYRGWNLGLLLITKDLFSCIDILNYCEEVDIPVIIHHTITTLGGTVLEPYIRNTKYNLYWLGTYLHRSTRPRGHVVLRVDPIIPGVTNMLDVSALLREAKDLGVTKVRSSVIDYYPFVRRKFEEKGLSHPNTFNSPHARDVLLKLRDICVGFNLELDVCAEPSILPSFEGIQTRGCADFREWEQYGLDLELSVKPQRKTCTCTVKKYDLLKGYDCSYDCLYCYWGKYK